MFTRLHFSAWVFLCATIGTGCNSSSSRGPDGPCDSFWEEQNEYQGIDGPCGVEWCEGNPVHRAEGTQFNFQWSWEIANEGGVSPGLEIKLLSDAPDVVALSNVRTDAWGIASSSDDDDPLCEAAHHVYGEGHADLRKAGLAHLHLMEGNRLIDGFTVKVSKIDDFRFLWKSYGTSGDTPSSATLAVGIHQRTEVTPVALSSAGEQITLDPSDVTWTFEPEGIFEFDIEKHGGVEFIARKEGTAVLRAVVGPASHELTVTASP